MPNHTISIRTWFRSFVIYYVCICLLGCTTAAYKSADAYANREPKYWTIEDVTFAAIRNQRFIRLCIKLKHFSEEAVTEVNIDLQKVAEQMKNLETTVSSIEEGAKLDKVYITNKYENDDKEESIKLSPHLEEESYAPCMTALQKNEATLPIIVKKTDGVDMSATLLEIGKEPPDHPALFLVEHGDLHYIIFGAPMQKYSTMTNHAFRCYAEDQTEPSRYLLIPLGVAGDVFYVMGMIAVGLVCILLLPLCILEMATNDRNNSNSGLPKEAFFPLPSDTFKPECN